MKFFLFLFLFYSLVYSSENLQKVSVQLEWKHQFEYAGFYAAIEQGYYKDIGLDVELIEFEPNIDIVDKVLSGKTTFGISSSSLILAKSKKLPVVLLASYFKQNVLALVTQKNITDLNQLKDKKLMATSFEVTHSSIGAMLKESKISFNEVDIVEHDYSIEKFKNKEIDAMTIFLTNQIYELNKDNIEYNVFTPQRFGLYSYDQELFTSETFAKNNYSLVKKFIEATNKGWEYAFLNKEKIIDLIYSKYSKRKSKESLLFEANETEKLFKREIFSVGSIAPELIRLNYDLYRKLGLIKDKEDVNELIDNYVFNSKNYKLIKYDFTKEELDYLKSNPILKVLNEKSFPPYNYIYNDKPSGFSVEYIKLLASKIGLKLKFESVNFKNSIEKVKKDEIDILLNIAKTDERLKYLGYLDKPYIKSELIFYINEKNKEIKDKKELDDLSGKTIAVVNGYYQEEILKKYYPSINILSVKTPLEALKAVSYGKADGTLSGLSDVINYYMNKHSIINIIPSFEIKDEKFITDLYIALNIENSMLKSILNKVQNNINENEVISLRKQFLEYQNKKVYISLPINQINFLEDKSTLNVCMNSEFNFLNFGSAESTYNGIAKDILNEIEQKLNIKFKYIKTTNSLESEAFLKDKKCDIIPSIVKTKLSEKSMIFTEPYLNLDLVVVTTKGKPYVNNFNEISNHLLTKKLGSEIIELLKEKNDNIKIIQKESHKDAFLSVVNEESYATIATLPITYGVIKKYNFEDLQIAGYLDMKYNISMAVEKDNKILLEILNQALDSIPKGKIKNIFDQWTNIDIHQQNNYSIFYKIIFVILGVLFILIYWNNKLSKEKEKVKKAMEEATLAKKYKNQFLVNLSDEIKLPISNILSFLDLTLESKLTNKQRDYLDKVNKNIKELLNTMNDILDLSKIEEGKLFLNERDFHLKQEINNIIYLFKDKVNKKNLNLNILYGKNLEESYFGDFSRISQIIINLLNNSLKFTDKGSIELKVVSISSNRLRFEITDTGRGISEANLKELFNTYLQNDNKNSKEFKKSKVKLSICKKLVELMNGKIWAESKLGYGSKFIFEIDIKNNLNSTCNNMDLLLEDKNRYSEVLKFKHIDAKEGLKNLNNNKFNYIKTLIDFKNKYQNFDFSKLNKQEFNVAVNTLEILSNKIGANSLNLIIMQVVKSGNKSLLPIVNKELNSLIQELDDKLSEILIDNKNTI